MTTNFGDNRRKLQLGISVGNFMALTNSSGLEYNSVTVVTVTTVTKSAFGYMVMSERTAERTEHTGTYTMKSVHGKRFGIFFVNL